MKRKVSPADRYRNALTEAVGAASLNFSGYCRLAAQAMLQQAMEAEVEQFVGFQRGRVDADGLAVQQLVFGQHLQHPGEHALVCLQINQLSWVTTIPLRHQLSSFRMCQGTFAAGCLGRWTAMMVISSLWACFPAKRRTAWRTL